MSIFAQDERRGGRGVGSISKNLGDGAVHRAIDVRLAVRAGGVDELLVAGILVALDEAVFAVVGEQAAELVAYLLAQRRLAGVEVDVEDVHLVELPEHGGGFGREVVVLVQPVDALVELGDGDAVFLMVFCHLFAQLGVCPDVEQGGKEGQNKDLRILQVYSV